MPLQTGTPKEGLSLGTDESPDYPLTDFINSLEQIDRLSDPSIRSAALRLYARESGLCAGQLQHLWATYSSCEGL